MKKDKEWFESVIIKELMTNSGNSDMTTYEQGRVSALKYYLNLIDQLDEPEKVVVPQFVADFITEIKPNFNIRAVFTLQNNKHEQGQEWAMDNPDVFARAWLDGYTIEQPKLLTVIVKDYDKTIMSKQLPEDEVNKMMEGLEK